MWTIKLKKSRLTKNAYKRTIAYNIGDRIRPRGRAGFAEVSGQPAVKIGKGETYILES